MTEHYLCMLFKYIWEKEERHANQKLKNFHLTIAQSEALAFVIRKEEPCTQKDFEDYMRISHSAVVGIVSRLTAKGMITVSPAPEDRRQRILCPTEKGRKTHEELQEERDAVNRDMLKDFSAEEITLLGGMLERIYHNLA